MCAVPDLIDLPRTWGEPRHRDGLGVSISMTAGHVYRLVDAFRELNAIVNDPDYSPPNFRKPEPRPERPLPPDDGIIF